ncbi:MAG: hypothetical protein ACOYCD_06380 [Kiritimatiellia bacterium]|jgi:hypothetical protein
MKYRLGEVNCLVYRGKRRYGGAKKVVFVVSSASHTISGSKRMISFDLTVGVGECAVVP